MEREMTKEEVAAFGKAQAWLDELAEAKGLFYSTIVHEVAMLRAILSEAVAKSDGSRLLIDRLVNFGAIHTSALVNLGGFTDREKEIMQDVDELLMMSVVPKDGDIPQPTSTLIH